MAIIGIVAVSRNFAIGKGGKLPWHYPADLKFFKETTTGNTVVMGANTWRAIGRELPNRLNVILSASGEVEAPPEIMKLSSVDEVVQLSRLLNGHVYIIGGALTYAAFADEIDEWIVTEVPEKIDGADAFLSEDFLDGFVAAGTKELDGGLAVKVMRRI